MVLTIFPTLAITAPRLVYLVLVLAYLKQYAIILIGLEVLVLMSVTAFYFKIDRNKAMMGSIASIFGPCFRLDELTNYYLVTSLTSGVYSFLSMLLLPIFRYGLLVYKDSLISGTFPEPSIIEKNCTVFTVKFDDFVTRSQLIQKNCMEIVITGLRDLFEHHDLFSYWYYVGTIIMWIVSLLATWFLHAYMKLSFRYQLSKWIHLNIFKTSFFNVIWPTADLIWYPFLNGVLTNKYYYENVDKDAKEYLGKSVLGYCLKSGHLELGKVTQIPLKFHFPLFSHISMIFL